jgi:spore germination protein GerM
MKACRFLAVLAILFLASCGTFQVDIESTPNPSASSAISPTVLQSPAVFEPPAVLQPPSSQPYPASEQSSPETQPVVLPSSTPQMVEIYLIALDDSGQSGPQVGCGDSAVPVQVPISPTKDVLKAALERLLALKTQYYGQSGLYNALYQSDLHLDGVNIKDGVAIINLSGSLQIGGECDSPRVEAQINQTALQFAAVKDVSVSINGRTLQDALSLK